MKKAGYIQAMLCWCRWRPKLSPYLDHELAAEIRAEVEQHLTRCHECRAQLESLRFASEQVAQLLPPVLSSPPPWRVPQPIPTVRKNNVWKKLIPATALLLLLLCGLFAWQRWRTPPTTWEVMRLAGAPTIGATMVTGNQQWVEGEWLGTDEQSRALVQVGSIGNIEVEPGSRVQLLTARAEEHRLSLVKGRLHASILAPPRLFFIETPAVTAIDYGCAYTLEVDESGASLLEVTSGWVSLQSHGREALVPAGAQCLARPQRGPGAPFLADASAKFRRALEQFDFENGGAWALDKVLAEARARDGLTLFYLLPRVMDADKPRVYERLAALVPPPKGFSLAEALERKNEDRLSAWREQIENVSAGINPAWPSPPTGSLRLTGRLNAGRFNHSATLLKDGRVLVAGGIEREGFVQDSAELYDLATGRFSLTGQMRTKRVGHTATLLDDGRVLLAGGSDGSFYAGALLEAELYDPTTGTFKSAGKLHQPRLAHQATRLSDGTVLFTGGQLGTGDKQASAELYDPVTGAFQLLTPMHAPRADHTATLLPNGSVLIGGGGSRRIPNESPLASAELYDPKKKTFALTGVMSVPRFKHSATLLPDGRVLILGGSNAQLGAGRYASAEIYDPATGSFAPTAQLHAARYKIRDAVVALSNGKVLVAGGGARLELFDPATGLFSLIPGGVGASRHYATATLLDNGEVLIIGGYLLGIRPFFADVSAWLYQP